MKIWGPGETIRAAPNSPARLESGLIYSSLLATWSRTCLWNYVGESPVAAKISFIASREDAVTGGFALSPATKCRKSQRATTLD